MLTFKEENHLYESPDGRSWLGITTLIGKFKEPFDKETTAAKCSTNKKGKWYGISKAEILAAWDSERDRSTELGSWYHAKREHDILNNGDDAVYKSNIVDGIKYAPEQRLQPGIYPEHLCYLESAGICGQSDEVKVQDSKLYIRDYKGLALDTEIPTITGFKMMNNIEKGDILFDGDGLPTTVINVSEVHINPCYRILFDTNDSIICDHEHRWVVCKRSTTGKFEGANYKIHYLEQECTTEEVLNMLSKGYKIKIKCSGSLSLPDTSLPIDPYLLGLWLGDGTNDCAAITNMHESVWKEIEKRGYLIGKDFSNGGSGKAATRTVKLLYRKLSELNLIKNKHLPDIYLRCSHKQRLDLLRGFMDADGHYNLTRKRCVMVTTKEWQADTIMNIVSSLGWKPTKIKAKTHCTNGVNKNYIDCFHVTFRSTENPFLARNENYLEDSQRKFTHSNIHAGYRNIKRVERVNTVPTKCIEVDSSSHTYLFSRNYIKTHNTSKEIARKSFVNWEGVSKKMLKPLQHLEDCEFNHYALQLSLYAYIILRHNPLLSIGSLTIEHVKFEEGGQNKYGYPIYKVDEIGHPVVKDIEYIELPYMNSEVITLLNYIKTKKI